MGEVTRYKVYGTYIDDYSHTQTVVDMVMADDYDAAQRTIRELEAERDALRAAQAIRTDVENVPEYPTEFLAWRPHDYWTTTCNGSGEWDSQSYKYWAALPPAPKGGGMSDKDATHYCRGCVYRNKGKAQTKYHDWCTYHSNTTRKARSICKLQGTRKTGAT